MHEQTTTSVTTIQVNVGTLRRLAKFRDPVIHKNWSQPIEALMNAESDIYVDVIAVDGKLAKTTGNEVLFQLGNEPPRFYYYKSGKFDQVDLSQLDVLTSGMRASLLNSPAFVTSS